MEHGRDALEPDRADTGEVDGEEERAEAMENDPDPDNPLIVHCARIRMVPRTTFPL